MKLIAFILSAYLLFLFTVPCCSFDNCPEEKMAQTTQKHEKGDGDCGACSPFFTCAGCSEFTATATETDSGFISIVLNNQYDTYVVSPVTEADYDFWQPPKLG